MINLINITKTYFDSNKQEHKVLKNVNLTLPKTGFISIVGKSGSGKSTLLNILGLLEKPSTGSIEINDTVIDFSDYVGRRLTQNHLLCGWNQKSGSDKQKRILQLV